MTTPAEALPPIKVVDTTTATLIEQLAVLGRLVLVVISAFGTIIAFVKTKDIAAFLVWVKGDEAKQALFAIATVATLGSSLWRTYVKRKKLVVTADAAPSSVAEVIR